MTNKSDHFFTLPKSRWMAGSYGLKSLGENRKKETTDLSTALRSPGFPVELGGVCALHAAFLNESGTRGHVRRRVA